MKKTVKAEIKSSVKKAMAEVVKHLQISKPSKKTRKVIARTEKALRKELKSALKKEIKNATRQSRQTEAIAVA
jgi:hypothetical protein